MKLIALVCFIAIKCYWNITIKFPYYIKISFTFSSVQVLKMHHVVRNIEWNKILIIFRILKMLSSDRGKCMFYLLIFFPFCGIFFLHEKTIRIVKRVNWRGLNWKYLRLSFSFRLFFHLVQIPGGDASFQCTSACT